MNNAQRIMNLIDGTKFRGTPDWSSEYPLMDLGNHNLAELDKLSDERKERAANLISVIVADIVQPLALKKFGNTDGSAIRTVVRDELFPQDKSKELDSLGQQVQKEALGIGLSEMQAERLRKSFVSHFPIWLEDCIAGLIDRWRLLPRSESSRMIGVLVEMFKEGNHVDSIRHTKR